jgi:hypothetical protein
MTITIRTQYLATLFLFTFVHLGWAQMTFNFTLFCPAGFYCPDGLPLPCVESKIRVGDPN